MVYGFSHAIGAGALITEIQEASNLTYRFYDYNRVDRNGRKRELHIDKALDDVDLKSGGSLTQPMRVLKFKRGCASEMFFAASIFK